MKSILHDQKIQVVQRLFQHVDVRKRNQRVGAQNPKRANPPRHRALNNVGISQAALRGDALHRHIPETRNLFAIRGAFKFAVPGNA